MFVCTILNRVRFYVTLCTAFVCSTIFAGDQEFGSAMAWGKLQVFKTCEKGELLHRTFDPQRQEWSDWKAIAKLEMTSAPSAVLTDEGSRLAVYFRGKDGRLHQVYRDRDTGWSNVWAFGDRKMESGPTALIVDGTLTVFARDVGGGLMKIYYDKPLGSWTKWIDVDPRVAPKVVVNPQWESKVIIISRDEQTATIKYNELKNDGWVLEGPVGNGMVAFKRPVKTTNKTVVVQDREAQPAAVAAKAPKALDGEYFIESSLKAGQVLDVWGAKTDSGTPIQLAGPGDQRNRRWRLIPIGEDEFLIESMLKRGAVLDFRGDKAEAGIPVEMGLSSPSLLSQRWKLVHTGNNGEYRIESSMKEGVGLEVTGGNPDNLTRIQLGGSEDEPKSRWRLIRVDLGK